MTKIIAGLMCSALLVTTAYAQESSERATTRAPARTEPGTFLVFFDTDGAMLTADAAGVVAEAAEAYRENGAARIVVSGHSDTTGSVDHNRELSRRRAETVANELIRRGVPATDIATIARGEEDLLVQTADGVNEPRNRRVEVVLAKPPPPEEPTAVEEDQPAATGEEKRLREIELALTNDSLQGRFLTDAGLVGFDGHTIGFGLLLSDDRDIVGSVEFLAAGVLRNLLPDLLELSFGARGLVGLLDDPDDDVVGIAPGAAARARLPFSGPPMYIASDFFYAPDILTFGDADAVLDFNVRYELQFLQNTTGFVGYRLLDFDREGGGEDDIVNTLMVGLRHAF